MVVVALGEPGVPVVSICALAEGATVITTAANIPLRVMYVFVIGVLMFVV
jgi:hypothetical protein